jgi:hypothetical protein
LEDVKAENEILHSQLESMAQLNKSKEAHEASSIEDISTSLLDENNIKDKTIEGRRTFDGLV